MKRSPVLRAFSYFPLYFLVLFLFVACSKHTANVSGSAGPSGPVDVYVAGILDSVYGNSGQHASVAKYWKNGVPVTLSDSTDNATAYAITVSGSDVYVSGWEYIHGGATSIAKYWKNGKAVNLTDGTTDAIAYGIAVSGSDVYVVGLENYVCKYWKNGVEVDLPGGLTNQNYAESIALSGATVLVGGAGGGNPAYWDNGTLRILSDSVNGGLVQSICVNGSDIYAAGYQWSTSGTGALHHVARYWKNGKLVSLTDGSVDCQAYSIAVSGSDVYAAGEINDRPVYWKNGASVSVSDTSFGPVYSIAVSGSDVYTAGSEYGPLSYRINSQRVVLDPLNSGVGFGIYLAKK